MTHRPVGSVWEYFDKSVWRVIANHTFEDKGGTHPVNICEKVKDGWLLDHFGYLEYFTLTDKKLWKKVKKLEKEFSEESEIQHLFV